MQFIKIRSHLFVVESETKQETTQKVFVREDGRNCSNSKA